MKKPGRIPNKKKPLGLSYKALVENNPKIIESNNDVLNEMSKELYSEENKRKKKIISKSNIA